MTHGEDYMRRSPPRLGRVSRRPSRSRRPRVMGVLLRRPACGLGRLEHPDGQLEQTKELQETILLRFLVFCVPKGHFLKTSQKKHLQQSTDWRDSQGRLGWLLRYISKKLYNRISIGTDHCLIPYDSLKSLKEGYSSWCCMRSLQRLPIVFGLLGCTSAWWSWFFLGLAIIRKDSDLRNKQFRNYLPFSYSGFRIDVTNPKMSLGWGSI